MNMSSLKIIHFFTVLAFLLFGQSAASQDHDLVSEADQDTVETHGDLLVAFRIDRDALSTQSNRPFHYDGKVVDRNHPQWRKFRRAINNYPDAEACLKSDAREGPILDMLNYDWEGIVGEIPNEVCFFRVLDSLGHIERARSWMEYHAIKLSDVREVGYSPDRYTRTFDGHWNFSDLSERSSIAEGFFVKSISRLLQPGTAFLVGYRDNELTAINIIAITK